MYTDYITLKLDNNNSFRIDMNMNILGEKIEILKAYFDTGCNNTMISLAGIKMNIKQTDLLYDPDIRVAASYGVEGKSVVNKYEVQLKRSNYSNSVFERLTKELHPERLKKQYCFCTLKALKYLVEHRIKREVAV